MLLVVSIGAFLTALFLFLALAQPLLALRDEALGSASGSNALTESGAGPLIRFFSFLNRRPGLESYRVRIEQKLLEAGKPGGYVTGWDFLAAAELCGLTVLVGMIGLFVLAGALSGFAIVFSLMVAGFALWLPHAWLDNRVSERRTSISRQFPFFLDLAVMTMEAGSTFRETMEIYERDNSDDVLAEEIRIVIGEIRMGKTLNEALENLTSRVSIEDVRNALNALIQAQGMGAPLGQVIRDQAEVMRFKRSQRAERLAEELKVRIQGPTMMMMISVFLLILGPAFIGVMRSGIF